MVGFLWAKLVCGDYGRFHLITSVFLTCRSLCGNGIVILFCLNLSQISKRTSLFGLFLPSMTLSTQKNSVNTIELSPYSTRKHSAGVILLHLGCSSAAFSIRSCTSFRSVP